MKRLVYSFGAVLIGAAATMGCTTETDGTGGNGGTGNTSQGGQGGSGAQGGSQGGAGGGQGGQGGSTSNATVDFEEAAYTTNEAGNGQVDVNVVLTLPAGETLATALTVTVEADSSSTATLGDDVVDPGSLQVTFPAGAGNGDMQALAIIPIADVEREGDEDMVLSFAASNTAMTGNDATVTITDDDALMVGHARLVPGDTNRIARHVDVHDPGTELSSVGGGTVGFINPEGAAYDEVANVTYVVSDDAQDLLGMVDANGDLTVIGSTGWAQIQCLAWDPGTSTLYGIDNDTDSLVSIDTTTGRGTVVGTVGAINASNVRACAYDSVANVLYAVDLANDELLTVDTTTGADSVVGSGLTSGDIQGLAFDPATSKLFGSDASGGLLREVNTTTGDDAAVGAYDDTAAFVKALAYDSTNNVLIGSDDGVNSVVEIADDTAALTHTNVIGAWEVTGLAYDATNTTLWGVTCDLTCALVSWDRATGAFLGGVPVDDPDAVLTSVATDGTTIWSYDDFSDRVLTIATDGTTAPLNLSPPDDLTGLAYGNGTLYGTSTSNLYVINTTDGSGTVQGGGYGGGIFMQGIAYVGTSVWGIEYDTLAEQFLYEITDPTDGSTANIIDQVASLSAFGLAHDGTSLFTIDDYDGRSAVATVDNTTADLTLINSSAVMADGLAFDPNTETVYITETDPVAGFYLLWALDLATGHTTLVGPLYHPNDDAIYAVHGLALDPDATTPVLYGADENGYLVTVDMTDATLVDRGQFDQSNVVLGMAWDETNGLLYTADGTNLYTAATNDATQTSVGAFTNHNDVEGLGYDPVTGTLFGVDRGFDNGETPSIFTVDTGTGESTTLRAVGRGNCSGNADNCPFTNGLTFATP